MIARARSFLFVPASRPDRFGKALACGADCVIVDLEDAVPPEQKVQARSALARQLRDFTREQLARTVVRINASGTPWHADDLLLLAEWTTRGIAGTMVPKAESPGGLRALGVALGPDACLLPLVESLAGFDAVNLIAATPQVARIAFGNLDFQLDVGMRCGLGEGELASVRFALVAASRRAGLPAPIDGVTADTSNVRRLADDVDRARGFGFGGKLCIHPGQVGALNAAFTSSEAEVEWARRVLAGAAANAGAAFRLDSRMVDLPVIRQAERTLQQAAQRPA